jgi:hypothetical protein
LLMPNSKRLTHGISNLVSLITKTKLGLSPTSSGHLQHREEKETLRQGSRRRGGRCNTRSTFETFKWNIYNIPSKTVETLVTYVWNTCKNNWKRLKKPSQNICNIQMKHMQHICETRAIFR